MSGNPRSSANRNPAQNDETQAGDSRDPRTNQGQSSTSSPILGQGNTRPTRQNAADNPDSHCSGCNIALRKTTGKSKVLTEQKEVDAYALVINKNLQVGSVICCKCRIKAYKKQPRSSASSETTASSPPGLQGFQGEPSEPAVAVSSPILGRSGPSGKSREKREKCDFCNTFLWKAGGRTKTIATQKEAEEFTAALGTAVFVGSVLCNKCRLKRYKQEAAPPPGAQTVDQSSQGSSESSSAGNQGSATSSPNDPSFFLVEKKRGEDEEKYAEMPIPRVVSTHKYCFICESTKDLTTVPLETRQQVFQKRRLFVPKQNRCCRSHLIKKKLYEDVLLNLKPYSHMSLIEVNDLNTNFLNFFTSRSESTMVEKVGDFTLAEKDVKAFTGLSWENLIELREMLHSMRNTQVRSKTQALVTFLFKMRTGNSNALIAAILGLDREQQVSEFCDSVLDSFEKDVLPQNFGVQALTREAIVRETSTFARKLLNISNEVALILDGTYVHHQKSSNNEYQRRSYSGQKKKPLAKPFTITTTNGFVVDTKGPFPANLNDAQILKEILKDENGLRKHLQQGDYLIVDRGFRDVVPFLEEAGYKVLMPALKGNRKQLTAVEANDSRKVTKIRWPVEAIHGIIGQKNELLHHQLDNKLLPKLGSLCRIVCFINNKFGKRLDSDKDNCEEILNQMASMDLNENSLATEVAEKHLGRRKVVFTQIKSSDLLDFPEMTEGDLKLLFTGTYQLSQSVSYLAEILDSENNLKVSFLKENPSLLRAEVPSRHRNSKTYKCFVEYVPDSIGKAGIRRYCCDCSNGNRTIGCCSHVAAIVYYLSHARYLSKIVRPAAILSKLFDQNQYMPIINEDSDED